MKIGFWAKAAKKSQSKSLSWIKSFHGLSLLFTFIALSACGGSGSETLLGGGFALGEVRPIEFDTQGQSLLSFGNLSGGEEFAVALFSAQEGIESYPIQVRSGNFSESHPEDSIDTRLLTSPSSYLNLPEGELEDPTTYLHQRLREDESLIGQILQEEELQSASSGTQNKFMAADTIPQDFSIENPWYETCANGQGVQVKVLSSASRIGEFKIICTHLIYQSKEANYYVDEKDLGNLPREQLLPILTSFENKLPLAREILGATESDVNNDTRFDVVFTGEINRLGAESGGFITGLFHGVNLLPTNIAAESNEREILFSSVPDSAGNYGIQVEEEFYYSNIVGSTLIHEYQHMVNYSEKVLNKKVGAELATLNEGLSHLIEGLQPGEDPLAQPGIENYSRFARFLAEPNLALMQGTTLAHRGGITLLLRYLYQQAQLGHYPNCRDGIDFVQQLITSDFRGIENIEAATGVGFEQLLTDFYAALILSGQDIPASEYYQIQGLPYGVSTNDHRGTVLQPILLEKLQQVNLDGQVPATGGWLSKLSGNTVKQAGNKISLLADQQGLFGGVVVRIR